MKRFFLCAQAEDLFWVFLTVTQTTAKLFPFLRACITGSSGCKVERVKWIWRAVRDNKGRTDTYSIDPWYIRENLFFFRGGRLLSGRFFTAGYFKFCQWWTLWICHGSTHVKTHAHTSTHPSPPPRPSCNSTAGLVEGGWGRDPGKVRISASQHVCSTGWVLCNTMIY